MAKKTDGKKSESAPKKARGKAKAKAKVKGKASKDSKGKGQAWMYSESCFFASYAKSMGFHHCLCWICILYFQHPSF